MSNSFFKKHAIATAIGASLMFAAAPAAFANNDGGIRGTIESASVSQIQGVTITIENVNTGTSRTIEVDDKGNFRFPRLPVGTYNITATKDGAQVASLENVTVNVGSDSSVRLVVQGDDIETITVTGTTSRIDTASTESSFNIGAVELERLPIARSVNSVALLAPGTAGGGRHGGLSFGGSSAAENAVYINGLNVTDPEVPTSFSSVPFTFYEDFQVKTGGYSAEFGRTTGGVVNAVVKSGGNDFKFTADTYWVPDSLRGSKKDRYDNDGNKIVSGSKSETDTWTASISASGPIIKDTLFFYALYEPRLVETTSVTESDLSRSEAKDDTAFWGGKLDYYITDNHLLEFIAFSDEKDVETDLFDDGEYSETIFGTTGGQNYIVNYTGYLTDSLTVKAMWGQVERQSRSNASSALECNRVMDYTSAGPIFDIGCTSLFMTSDRINERESVRLDFEWEVTDSHLLRFGYDNETRTTVMDRAYPGMDATRYQIYDASPGESLNGETLTDESDFYVRARTRKTFGNFETETSAIYLEDIWTVTDTLTATIGVRWDEFDTTGAGGTGFMKVDEMISPRLGLSWDVNGDGETKVFANAGRYYYPLPNSLVAREGGGTVDISNYYYLENGIQDADGFFTSGFTETMTSAGLTNLTPNLGSIIGEAIQFGDVSNAGEDQSYRVDNDIEASYQDEYILGFETMVNDNWAIGARAMYRKFENAIEDMKIYHDWGDCDSPGTWLIGNPGKVMTLNLNCNGTQQIVSLDTGKTQIDGDHPRSKTGEDIGSPVPFRKYASLDLVVDRQWDDVWQFYASYTWAHSWGNYEGGVNSDTTNDIAGWLEYGDDPAYLIGGYGDLPNDVRHTFKFYGAYAITEDWLVSANFVASSGRPINIRGVGNPYTTDEHYYMNWVCVETCGGLADGQSESDRVYEYLPRGEERLDWTYQLDLGTSYSVDFGEDASATFSLDVFNVFNTQETLRVDSFLTTPDSVGNPNPDYGLGTSFQSPRRVQLSAIVRF
ncbi:TonB-dependent receptor [Thalassotalea mangrovi]|uniref:TonB-dependent receptor n=1 Tax=Thalassotalea mangrovi TaxID=2572245 RepID=A0A4U1B2A2_9GAMM|nr:TonB-dependent receptor [Thalassotalea mangrovi]TKB43531.1 TonB-dependent receptor [Thalassotalea mangrovi]